ncbi:hypothetical protein NQ317_012201 [Molorchus minor]|uniref:Retrotransposon gag domain-containing protein n=1 Tax=Molorchus minor TaxID=1323400 RepID=A0ABQ9IS48_9CUCU|nr:hypothetical protein NQ317_012201 [Molorchus minor]
MDFRGVPPMQTGGNITENWKFWKQRFLTYLRATEICKKEGATKCAQLLTLIGDEGMHIYNTFVIPDDQKDDLDYLILQYDSYFNPRRNLAFERHKLLICKQKEAQTIEQYATELKNLAKACELGELKDSLTKDILICGIKCENLREKLLEKDVDSLDEAISICINVENTKERNRQITNGTSSREAEVNAVRNQRSIEHVEIGAVSEEAWSAVLFVNDEPVTFKIDTGAMANIIPDGRFFVRNRKFIRRQTRSSRNKVKENQEVSPNKNKCETYRTVWVKEGNDKENEGNENIGNGENIEDTESPSTSGRSRGNLDNSFKSCGDVDDNVSTSTGSISEVDDDSDDSNNYFELGKSDETLKNINFYLKKRVRDSIWQKIKITRKV